MLHSFWGFNPLKHPIEVVFPVNEINRIAEMESTGFGRRHYRPVYVMHKWWARRLGSVFRALLLYSLADERLEGWDGSPKSLWHFYSKNVNLREKIVLDPMMGGGTTIVEALKLGCKVIGGDINPVSWFIVKKTVETIDPKRLGQALTEIEKDLGSELRRYYRTLCPECGNEAEGIYYFYRKEVSCPKCANAIPLMRNFFLSKSHNGQGDYVVCPGCWNVFLTKSAKKVAKCPKCDNIFIASRVSFVSGRRFRCQNDKCGTHSIVEAIRKRKMKLDEKLYAVEFYCKYCDESGNDSFGNGRGFKAADSKDLTLLEAARREFRKTCDTLPLPDIPIPLGVETRRALNHGYTKFRDMFSHRQLLNLGKIYRWILELKDENLREFLIMAFSNCLKYNNMFAKYNATRGFITDIFRTHSFSPSISPVEANCYDISKGRGSFTAFVNLVIEGKEYCQDPFERVFVEDSMKKVSLQTRINGLLAQNYKELDSGANVFLQCGSSDSIPVPSSCVDAVVTDPPYFDNVMYSELSNFFYVWLRLGLMKKYSVFEPEYVPWDNEIIENQVQAKGREEYMQSLADVFSESNRILKEEGVLVFTFHHRKMTAWGALLEALLKSGFYIVNIYPVRSEMRASTHLYDMRNIAYDLIFVCRKRAHTTAKIVWSALQETAVKSAAETVENLRLNSEDLNTQDIFAVVLAKWLQLYSMYYPNITIENKRVDPNQALLVIETEIDDVLQRVLLRSL
jgi:putative DNA methylase